MAWVSEVAKECCKKSMVLSILHGLYGVCLTPVHLLRMSEVLPWTSVFRNTQSASFHSKYIHFNSHDHLPCPLLRHVIPNHVTLLSGPQSLLLNHLGSMLRVRLLQHLLFSCVQELSTPNSNHIVSKFASQSSRSRS